MASIFSEVVEWLDHAEQAREVAAQLTDPARGRRYCSWPRATIDSREQPRPGEGSWRRKTRRETHDNSRAFLSQTTSVPREVEKNGSAQRAVNPGGTGQDYGAARFADRPLCRTQSGDGRWAGGSGGRIGSRNRQPSP